ncbi:hypothetical protein [Nocardia sp. NPDC004711]
MSTTATTLTAPLLFNPDASSKMLIICAAAAAHSATRPDYAEVSADALDQITAELRSRAALGDMAARDWIAAPLKPRVSVDLANWLDNERDAGDWDGDMIT